MATMAGFRYYVVKPAAPECEIQTLQKKIKNKDGSAAAIFQSQS